MFLNIHYATPAFFKLYDIKVIEGEIPDINKENRRTVFVVNKAALKALGYTSINGAGVIEENQKRANANASLQPIVAVVEDYFEGHLTSGIKPTIYSLEPVHAALFTTKTVRRFSLFISGISPSITFISYNLKNAGVA